MRTEPQQFSVTWDGAHHGGHDDELIEPYQTKSSLTGFDRCRHLRPEPDDPHHFSRAERLRRKEQYRQEHEGQR